MTSPSDLVAPTYCSCAEPYFKVWADGTTFCTRCGWHRKPDELPKTFYAGNFLIKNGLVEPWPK